MTQQSNRFGPLWLQPGVTRTNMFALFGGALTTIGLMTFMGIGTPMVLSESLGIPSANHGAISGYLHTWQEIVALAVFGAIGVLADRVGRRTVYVAGLLCMAIGYAAYSYATTLPGLFAYRLVYAVGIAAATAMLSTVLADYTEPRSRGITVAMVGVLNAVGVIAMAIGGKLLPAYFAAKDATQLQAAHHTYLTVAAICIGMAGFLAVTLRGGTPVARTERPSTRELIRSGFAEAAANPRIALAYGCAFIARSDLVLLGTYLTLWGYTVALQDGATPMEATVAGSHVFQVASMAALAWLIVIGLFIDRFNRITAITICMSIAAVGYLSTMFIDDPRTSAALPLVVLLGIGQISAFAGAQTLISKETVNATRASVIGMFNAFGAAGILVSTFVGGILFDRIGPHAPFAFVGVMTLGLIVAAIIVRRKAPGPLSDRDPDASARA